MLKKLCKCGEVIPITVKQCEKCNSTYQKEYDLYKRTNKEFYNSKAWRKLRLICMQRFNGIDIYHYYKTGRVRPGTLPHHIVEVEDDMSKSLELDNLIWISDASHKEIHGRYTNNKKETQRELRGMVGRWLKEGDYKKV